MQAFKTLRAPKALPAPAAGPRPKRRILLLAAAGVGGLVILGAGAFGAVLLLHTETPHVEAAAPPPPPPPPPIELPQKEGPKAQRAFLAVIAAARAALDLPGGGAAPRLVTNRATRAEALCAALKDGPPRRWVGTISQVGQNEDKLGTLTIEIAPGVSVKTWNTAPADAGYGTLLDPKSIFFQAADVFGRGQQVVFSGTFFPSPLDCVSLANLNPASALREPAFILKFEDLRPLGPVKSLVEAEAKAADGKGKAAKDGAKDGAKGDHTGSVPAKH